MNQEQNIKHYDSRSYETGNFEIQDVFDIKMKSSDWDDEIFYLSPYNSLLMILQKIGQRNFRKLYKYQKNSLLELKSKQHSEGDIICAQCKFMKNCDEFIIVHLRDIEFCHIEEGTTWKSYQLFRQSALIGGATFNEDEQILVISGFKYKILKRTKNIIGTLSQKLIHRMLGTVSIFSRIGLPYPIINYTSLNTILIIKQ